MTRALVLVGLSGSGKSTVGRLLAPRLGLPFVDTDRLIEARRGATVARIFACDGEDAFRQIEYETIAAVCTPAQIVATGGGAVLRQESRAAMRDGNLVVWLDVAVQILARRLSAHVHGEERPLLRGASVLERLEQLARERGALYRQVAHIRCSAPDGEPSGSHRIAVELAAIYRAWSAARDARYEAEHARHG
jgi:shikimate kinase